MAGPSHKTENSRAAKSGAATSSARERENQRGGAGDLRNQRRALTSVVVCRLATCTTRKLWSIPAAGKESLPS